MSDELIFDCIYCGIVHGECDGDNESDFVPMTYGQPGIGKTMNG